MSDIVLLNDSNFDTEVESNSKPVLVDFYADWCAPCQLLSPRIEEIAREFKDRITVGKFNVDQSISTPVRFGIQGIPTVLFFKDGQVADRVVGLVPKEELAGRLDSLLGEQK